MNIYMLMEGETEPLLYPVWLKFIAPNMQQVFFVEQVKENNFYVITGKGYPRLVTDKLEDTIKDITDYPIFDQLWIILDADDRSVEEREQEAHDKVTSILLENPILSLGECQVHVIAQKVCIETWGLANTRVFPHHKMTGELRNFYDHYDISSEDPEDMDKPISFEFSVGAYHHKYLKTMLRTRNEKIIYSKKSPSPLNMKSYFDEIVLRVVTDGQVNSFKKFYNLAVNLN